MCIRDRCYDSDGVPLKAESIEPPRVKMYVPENFRTARVELTLREIEQARRTALRKHPFILLYGSQRRVCSETVLVKLAAEQTPLGEQTVTGARLGIMMSVNLQGKYRVELTNLPEVLSPIKIRSSSAAKQAYESQRYQVILEVDDDDLKVPESRRELIYNFPDEFIASDQIKLDQPAVEARFKLVPLPGESP